jgi:hypothetical protein
MAAHWHRENARVCAWRASRDPLAKASYKEMLRCMLILAACAVQLVSYQPSEAHIEEQVLAA